jgi:integrase
VIRVREAIEQTQAGIRFKEPKTEAGRRDITLPDDLIAILRDHRRLQLEQRVALGRGKSPDDALVFPNRDPNKDDTPESPNALTLEWSRVAAALGIGVSFHALRHTHASQLIARGISIPMVAKRLGHASQKVTLEVYSHMFETTDAKAADAIGAALSGLLRP